MSSGPPASAQADSPASARSDSVAAARADSTAAASIPQGPWYKQPKWVMLRSVVIPGWGQATNHKYLKAALAAGGEGYLIYWAAHWRNREQDYQALADENAGSYALNYYYQYLADQAGASRRDYTWWTIFATVLSMGDAYVDAQLGRRFDAQFKPQEQSVRIAGTLPPTFAVQLGLSLKLP